MKRSLSVCLILLLIAALSVTAWAENTSTNLTPDYYSDAIPVRGSYLAKTDTVYSVDLTWGDMLFQYVDSDGVWNPAEHKYTNSGATWIAVNNGNTITVTNHSNAAIVANFTALNSNDIDVTASLSSAIPGLSDQRNIETTLDSAVGTSTSNAPSDTITVSLNGALESTQTEVVDLSTISITISPAE